MGIDVDAQNANASSAGWWSLESAKRRLAANALLRHNVLLFAANMITSLFSYLYHPVTGHLLGPNGYGSIASLMALTAVFAFPTQIVGNISNKFAADLNAQGRVDQINYLLRKATRYALLTGLITAIVYIALSSILSSFLKLSSIQPLVIMSLGLVLSFAAPLNFGVMQGRQQFAWFGVSSFLVAFLRVVLTAAFLVAGFGVNGALVAALLGSIIVYGLSFLALRDVFQAPRAAVSSLRPLLVYSVGASLALGGNTLLGNTDVILAKHFLTPTGAGYYSALATIGRIVLFVSGSLVWVMFPKVAALHQRGESHHMVLVWTMAGVLVLSSGVVLLFWLFPSQIITLIFHAPTQVANELVWYGLAMLMLALGNVLMYYFLSLGRMAFVPILLVCCGLQAILIIAWHGDIAQIVMTMVGTMAVLLCGLVALYATMQRRTSGRSIPS